MAEDDVLLSELNLKASFKVMLMGCVRLPSSRPCKKQGCCCLSHVMGDGGAGLCWAGYGWRAERRRRPSKR
jgi:hypothetical protein